MMNSKTRGGTWLCTLGALMGLVPATVRAQGVDPGFAVEVWAEKGFEAANRLVTNVTFVRNNPPTAAERDIPVINFNDSNCPGIYANDTPYPVLPPPPNDRFIMRATGYLFFPNTDLVVFGVRSDDGFQLNIEGVEVGLFDGGRACDAATNPTDVSYVPPRAGFLEMELIQWEGTGGSGVEFDQVFEDGSAALVNDPNDLRSLRVFQIPNNDTAQVIFEPAGPLNVTRHDPDATVRLFVPSNGQGQATATNAVTITSSDPAAAAVIGSPVNFVAGERQVQEFAIDFGGPGTANLSLSDTAGLPIGPDLVVNVVAVQSLDLQLPSPLRIGSSRRVDVVGAFGAAGTRNLTEPDTGTTYASSDENVATVDADGVVTAVGLGRVDITATNGGQSDTVTVGVVAGSARVSDGLVVLYTFQEGTGAVIRDVSGVGDPLDMTMAEPELTNWIPEGLEVPVPSLRAITTEANGTTVRPATKVIEGSMATEEITVEAWVTPFFNDDSVGGPARILSCSLDQGVRNWSLLQEQDRLQMRIRTTVGATSGGIPGGNGCPCGLRTDPGTIQNRLHHIVVTRDAAGTLTIYIDGQVAAMDSTDWSGSFSGWAPEQGLMIINENVLQDGARDSRDWRGIYHLAAVYSRALTPEEVTVNFELGRTGCPEVTTVSHVRSEAISLASVDVPTQIDTTVAIPQSAEGTVTVTSSNPAVAGGGAASFIAFGPRCGTVTIDVDGIGETTLDLSSDLGFGNGPSRTVRVISAQSIDLQISTAAMEIGDTQQAIVMADFGAAGLRNVSDGDRFGTRYTSSDTAVATVDEITGVVTAVGVGTVEISATNDTTDTETIFVAERLTRLAFLVGSGSVPTPNEGDRAVLDHLNSLRFSGSPGQLDPNGLPPRIQTFSELNFDEAAIDAEFDLLITSSTVSSGNVGGKFRCLTIPHIFWEPALNRAGREGLTNGGGSRDAADLGDCAQGIFVLDSSHPITQGFTDPDACVSVFDSPQPQFYSGVGVNAENGDTLAPGARRLAESIVIDEASIIVAEAGGARVDGSPILGRRVFLWLVDDSADNLNDTGLEIVSRSVNWALGGQRIGADALTLSGPEQMRVGFCVQLAARASNAGGLCSSDVTFAAATRYSSSDSSIAQVNENGLVRAEAAGIVTVTATNGGLQSTATIEVGDVVGRVTDGLIALYEFQEGQGGTISDTSGVGTPLNLLIPDQNVVNWLPGGGLAVTAPSPAIASPGPASKIIDACTASNELTVEAWIRPASLGDEIDGPARIVSCSVDSGNRNFSVLQEFMPSDGTARMQARLRTTSSGNNGSISYDTVAAITSDLQQVVFTRDATGASHIYIDAVDMAIDTGNTFGGDLSNWDASYRLMLANEDVSDLTSRDWQGEYHLVAIYGKALTADEVAQNFGIPTECPPRVVPELVQIAAGLGGVNRATGLADTFISPLGEACALTAFSLEASEPLTLNTATVTYTGAGPTPGATLVDDGGGQHTVRLEPAPEPGEWVKIELDVTGAGGGMAVLTVWVAHQPLDITQDGRTNIQDATAFGTVFGGNREERLIDSNCDGQVSIQDATAFGTNWNGVGTSQPWANTALPPKP